MLNLKSDLFFIIILLKTVLSSDVCTMPECRKASSDILSFIDPSVDPCEDFYKFTCSGIFRKTHEAKPASLEEIIRKELEDQTTMMLIKPIGKKDPLPIVGLKKFFSTCMDEAAIEKYTYNTVWRDLTLIGGWPAVEGMKWTGEDYKIEEVLIKMRRLGYEFTQLFDISPTADNGGTYVISQPKIKPIEDKDKENYLDYMVNTALLYGANEKTAVSELQEVILFKQSLFSILEHEVEVDIKTIREWEDDFTFISWTRFLNNIIDPNAELFDSHYVYFSATDYFQKLENLLNGTSPRTIQNYLVWEIITHIEPYLPKRFRELKYRYLDSNDSDTDEGETRLSFCKNMARKALPPTFELLYLQEYFTEETKKKIEDLSLVVSDELIRLISETTLYDDNTRNQMVQKAKSIIYAIGGPDEVFDKHLLADLFDENQSVRLNTNVFLTAASILNRQWTNFKLCLDELEDRSSNYGDTLLDKMYYSSEEHTMMLPAGILHGLNYNEKRPYYLNFGTIGKLLSSELFHVVSSLELWTNATKSNFENRSECLIAEIEDFEIQDSTSRMKGEQVLDASLSDQAGVELAYRAYEQWISRYGEEKELPGLNYTPKQLFWISTASTFCDTIALDKIKDFVANETTAFPNFRTINSISNNENFGEDFNCPKGTLMNPIEKCKIF